MSRAEGPRMSKPRMIDLRRAGPALDHNAGKGEKRQAGEQQKF